jgi:ribonucleotide monophosphatase NagD (HAD superfamily)
MRRERGLGCPIAVCESDENVEAHRAAAARWGLRWARIARRAHARPAAVFDVDATLLDGDRAIPSICALHADVQREGIATFVVTARSDEGRAVTDAQLSKIGVAHYAHMFMHPARSRCTSWREAAAQKQRSRERISERGYTIVLNVGDSWGDHLTSDPTGITRRATRDRVVVYVDPRDAVAHVKLPAQAR